jgi:hypothetical protein
LAREVLIWFSWKRGAMQYGRSFVSLPAITAVLTLSGYAASAETPSAPGPASQAAAAQERKQPPKSESQEKVTALVGCVDEKEGHYVLVDDRNLSPITRLEAEGFPTESFAKHLGHKVTVRGTSNSAGTTPTFKVRSIETISEVCGPKQ